MNFSFILALLMIACYFIFSNRIPNYRIRPIERIVVLISLALATIFTSFPISSHWIAYHLNIESGSDLIVYSYIAISWICLYILYRRLTLIETRIDSLMQKFLSYKLLDEISSK